MVVMAAMQRRGWTITDLARESGVSRSALGRWLRGDRSITVRTLDRVWAALGLEITEKAAR